MKILHTADWHLGDRLGRIDRTSDLRRAVERIGRYCEEERVDVLLAAGDLFSELSRPDSLRESIAHLQAVFLPFLQNGGTLVALTGNHDNENFCQTLRNAMRLAAPESTGTGDLLPSGRLYLAAEPTLLRLQDREGTEVQFVLMPYPTPSRYLDATAQHYRNVEEKNRALRAAFSHKLREIEDHAGFSTRVPTVLAAHIHVEGARLPGPFRISERESILVAPNCLSPGYAYVALGHIHQAQSLNGSEHVRYSGSIERLDLGEREDAKSVVLADIETGGRCREPVCLSLEATPMYHVDIVNPKLELPLLRERYPDAERALVRYHLQYTAGEDNLEEILRELDHIFPRWYDRDWHETGALRDAHGGCSVASLQSFHDSVHGYLQAELMDHPDRDQLLSMAEELLAEEAE
jgi:exonuclease SbcD